MNQLETLKNLGVTTLSVTNDLATAVNPHQLREEPYAWTEIANLPPLPTSGIPDRLVGIGEVEPELQYCISTEWFPMIWPDAVKSMNYETRLAIRYKQQEEVKPEEEEDEANALKLLTALNPPQPKQPEQTTLGNWLRNKLRQNESMSDFAVATETVRCWIEDYEELPSLPQPEQPEQKVPTDSMEDYAEYCLSQYKASLIEKLESELKDEDDPCYTDGIMDAIHLIKNS